jgi:hypothetical protein
VADRDGYLCQICGKLAVNDDAIRMTYE